ncbi:MAG: hypothetical protein WBJ21_05620 [Burkholderiaceae bacterium]
MSEEQNSEVFRSNAPSEKGINEPGKYGKKPAEVQAPEPSLREFKDSNATGTAGKSVMGEVHIAATANEALASTTLSSPLAEIPAEEEVSNTKQAAQEDMPLFKVEEDAVPWALAIDLAERIKSLGMVTAEVNGELDILEAASAKLNKRMNS